MTRTSPRSPARRRLGLALSIGAAIAATFGIGSAITARPLSPAEEAKVQPDGKPVPCLSLERIDETRVRDDRTIDFMMHGGKVYRNRLPYSCPSLAFEERFAYSTGTQDLCSSDAITVLQGGGGGPGASCGLGEFQPVTGVPR
jgi:hypothetical protein